MSTSILSTPSLDFYSLRTAVQRQEGVSTLFIDAMLPALWEAAVRLRIDPVVMVAQSGLETGWGTFKRAVQPWMYNTCGLKVRNPDAVVKHLPAGSNNEHTLCHEAFWSWADGASGQGQHLRAYAQMPVLSEPILDPRYVHIIGRKDPIVFVEDLGGVGRWAPRADYGTDVAKVYARLMAAAVSGG